MEICFICLKSGENFQLARNISFLHPDGTLLNPLEILLKIIAKDVNFSNVDQTASCCNACTLDLHNLAILERNLQKLKEEILLKLRTSVKTEDVIPTTKRNKVKPIRYNNESEEFVTEECDPTRFFINL